MRSRMFHRSILVALAVLSVGLLGWPASTGAQILGGTTTTTLLDTGTLAAGTVDGLDTSDIAVSIGSLNLTIAGMTITADSVVAEAQSPLGGGGVGTSYVDNLSIDGVTIPIGGSANQLVALPNGQLVINEHLTLADGTLVVNALHATISGTDVVVASATAGAGGGNAHAAQATF
jgi:hypothetical protein